MHTLVGAATGAFAKSKLRAFLTGVVSHLITDALPHKDCSPSAELSLLGAALGGVSAWKGIDSPEFWGAVGGILPDAEHALELAGCIDAEHKVFPTHFAAGRYHGRKTRDRWPQLIVTAASLVILLTSYRRKK